MKIKNDKNISLENKVLEKIKKEYTDNGFYSNNVIPYLYILNFEDDFLSIGYSNRNLDSVLENNQEFKNTIDIFVKEILGKNVSFGFKFNETRNLQNNIKRNNGISKLDLEIAGDVPKSLIFQNYLQVEFNRKCFIWAKNADVKEPQFNPVYIYGPSGLGKTHLVVALTNNLNNNSQKNSAIYLSSNHFPAYIAHRLKENDLKKIELISNRLKEVDLLVFDDFQSYTKGEKIATLNFIFNLLEYRINHNKLTVFIADKDIRAISSSLEKRLLTRLDKSLQLNLVKPTREDIANLFKFKLKQKNFDPEIFENDSIEFIVRNFSTSIRSLEGAINSIKFFEQTVEEVGNIKKYTLDQIKIVFENIKHNEIDIDHERIIDYVSAYYKVPKKKIISSSRDKEVVIARDITIYLIRSILDLSLVKIGKIIGDRSHATIIAAIKRVDKLKNNKPKLINNVINDLEWKIKNPS